MFQALSHQCKTMLQTINLRGYYFKTTKQLQVRVNKYIKIKNYKSDINRGLKYGKNEIKPLKIYVNIRFIIFKHFFQKYKKYVNTYLLLITKTTAFVSRTKSV